MSHPVSGSHWLNRVNLIITLVLAIPGCLMAQEYFVADIGSDNGLLKIYTAKSRPDLTMYGKSDDGSLPLRMSFYLENISGSPIESALVTAYVFTETGAAKGFYSLTIQANLEPNETAYYLRKTSAFDVTEADRVILVLEEILGAANTWQIPEEALADLNQDSILPVLESAAELTGLELKEGDPCIAFCDSREAKCFTTCTCGVQEFACSCGGDGTRSSNCKCQICRQ